MDGLCGACKDSLDKKFPGWEKGFAMIPLASFLGLCQPPPPSSAIGTASASFDGSTDNYLHVTDASLQLPDGDFTLCGWAYVNSFGELRFIASKSDGDTVFELFFYFNDVGYLTAEIYNTDFLSDTVQIEETPALENWHFCCLWRDSGTFYLSLNNGTPVSTAVTGTQMQDSSPFLLGGWLNQSSFDGYIDAFGKWDRALDSDERAFLYNSGAGRNYGELDSSLKTDLVSWWDLDETSGTRYDAHGSNDLAEQGTVGYGPNVTADDLPSSLIASIQPFEITIGTGATSNTASITGVDTSRSVIFFGGFQTSHTLATHAEFMPRVELTDGTTVTAYRTSSSATHTVTVRGTVVEFAEGVVDSVQQGTVAITAGNTVGTDTITSVDTDRSAVFYLGLIVGTTSNPQSVFSMVELTDATTVTATRGTLHASAVVTLGYCVVEFAEGIVQSVQPRTVSLTNTNTSDTDTIASVDMGNTLLLYNGTSCTSSTLIAQLQALELTAADTVTLERNSTSNATRVLSYTALEFVDGFIDSIQRDITAMSAANSADASITAVDTSKAVCNWTGAHSDGSSTTQRHSTAKLLDTDTVQVQRGDSSNNGASGWEVIVFV